MKKLILISMLCLLLASLTAVPVSRDEALSVATGWMRHLSPENTTAEIIAITNPLQNNLTDWFLVSFEGGGYILVSADDAIHPILGYSRTGSMNYSSLPEFIRGYFNQYHEEIAAIRNTQSVSAHPGWDALRNGDYSGFLPDRPVSPLLTTTWDQDWPYNSMCPADAQGPGGRVYAGCGASALAQIMKFWAYPAQGTGSNTYYHATYGSITANFGATTYNYSSMPNVLYYTPNTALSTLMFHAGVAINMDYGPNGSGSYASAVRPALVNFFNYESTAQLVYKSSYTTANWEAAMRTELDAGRPVYYFGQDTVNGGHAFVCDGYQGTNYFHFNWGWNGWADGYFYLSNLNPGQYQFNSSQGAVIGIRPTAPVAPATNLTATVDAGNNIFLEWQSPLNRALLGFTLYRNGVIHGTTADPFTTYYYDINPQPGTYTYYVVANFSQGDSAPSNTVVATIYPAPVINYQESFANFSDFATDLSPWFTFDLDAANTVEFDYSDFPGEGGPLSFMVFNPASAVPPMPEFAPLNGDRVLICFPSAEGANNDWFCSPKWNTGSQARLRFWAKSVHADNLPAKIRVGYNLPNPQPDQMTIISGATPVEVPSEWTRFEYIITGNTHTNLFIGVNCVTDNGSVLLLDQFQLWTSYVSNDDESIVPTADLALKAGPNPFSSTAVLSWQQKESGNAVLRIYDLKGRLVRTLDSGFKSAGSQSLNWDATDLQGRKVSPGIYFIRLNDSHGNTATQKVMYIR